MKIYLLSLGAGLLVGVVYGLLGVRSPAPPIVALVGLLGILIGEQAVPFARHAWLRSEQMSPPHAAARAHLFGRLPGHGNGSAPEQHDDGA
jgi:XapX domain-containing protein